METKLTTIKKIRKEIINDSSSKSLKTTHIDEIANLFHQPQYVIVKDIIEETNDTKSYILIPDKNKKTEYLEPFTPGQYISVKMFIDDAYATRAYSLSSTSKEALNGMYRITIKRVENGLVSNAILDQIKVGDRLTISQPMGDFGYNPLRDEENVIAIAGGVGITPFISLAKSILDGMYDINLTVFYSVRTYQDIILKKEIDEINKKSKKVKFIITLTREEKEGYLTGHINKEMIEPYLKEFNTIFMCGPKELYKTMNEILSEKNIPRKSVHYENYFVDYEPNVVKTYTLKVINRDEIIETTCKSNETLLVSLENSGIKAPSMCRVGTCGYCRSILVSGKIKMIGGIQPKVLGEFDYIHPCITYPESNIVLRLDI